MTLDPGTIRTGDMLLHPSGQLYIVTYVTRIDVNFKKAEGWEPFDAYVAYVLCFKSLDGQETNSDSFRDGSQMVGWELIASVPEEPTNESTP